jgi:hypothetical protein
MKIIGTELKDIVTVLLALYGAVMTTIHALWKKREYKYRVAVFCDLETDRKKRVGDTNRRVVMIRAVNEGHRVVEIIEIGLREKSGTALSKEQPTPYRLDPGFTVTAVFPYEEVLSRLEFFTEVFAQDAAKRVYKSKLTDSVKKKIGLAPALDATEMTIETLNQLGQSQQEFGEAIGKFAESYGRWTEDVQKQQDEQDRKYEEYDRYQAETGKRHPEHEAEIQQAIKEARAIKEAKEKK